MLPKLKELELSNGFRALLVERHTLPIVCSMVWYRVGSRDERSGETGLSHFLEHMMFKGTNTFGKGVIDQLTGKMGGSNNAFTDNDVTSYYFSLASDRWEKALEIEASRMSDCLLDEREFSSEKSVVLEELAMGEDDPWSSLYQDTESMLFQVHPYHHPVIGWKEDVTQLSVDAMRAYYQRHYGPDRAFLVAVGDFEAQRVADRIEGLFGQLPASTEKRQSVLREPEQRGERRAVIRSPHSVARMALAFKTCSMGDRDDFVLDVVAHALGSSKSSRLYRRLVLEEQLVTHVNAMNEPRIDPGVFWVVVELREGADPPAVESMVREEILALCQRGVRVADIRRIRTQLRSSFLFEDETVLDAATKIGRFEALTTSGYRLLDKVLSIYDEIDKSEIATVAKRYLQRDRCSVVWSLPEDAPYPDLNSNGVRRTRPRKK